MHRYHLRIARFSAIGFTLLAACVFAGVMPAGARAETTVTIAYFDGALLPYGYWVEDPDYGRVWRPRRIPADWRPYAYGTWVYTRDYGWVWVSDEPFGWVVYHYGRWVWSDHYGWVWVAGYDWAPAWVEWCYGGGYVGWAPMPPDPYWRGSYYHGSYDCSSPAYYSRAVFVSQTYYGRPGMSRHVEPASRNGIAASATVNVTAYSRGPSGITNRSVDVGKLEAATGQPIKVVPVVLTNAPVAVGAGAGTALQLKIFRPGIADLGAPKLETPPPLRLDQERPDIERPGLARPDISPPALPPIARPDTESAFPPLDGPGRGSLSAPPGLEGRSLPGAGLGGGLLGR